MKKALQIIYLILCVAALVYSIPNFSNSEFGMIFGLIMMFLTFPIGILVSFLLSLSFMVLDQTFGVIVTANIMTSIIIWFVYVVVGFWQWFILPDYLNNRFGKKADSTAKI